ncbi:PGPGW domain-containing protein [Pseudonocardia lacus]|uniref:PGPGW domain-containing protein n=1 Tax=Pseudonocardia lacus TaxID=2835865 RepID=UPI001BDDB703|nr:PGPGW domain-containing protein [Pseudonocardia lacus]
MADRRRTNPAKRVLALIAGGVLLVVGLALLVLPGPGLLLVLSGLLVLSNQFPSVERYVDPVQDRAMLAAEQSVSSPLRIAGSVLAGLVLVGAGVAWGLLGPRVPLGGWPTGSSLILSGLILLGLLVYSYRRVATRRREQSGDRSRPA